MSHSKGFLGTCNGRWVQAGRPRNGIQQQRCGGRGGCGKIRGKAVRKCWFSCSYRDKGKPEFGAQQQACTRCGDTRERRRRPCPAMWLHRWTGKGQEPGTVRCIKCGTAGELQEGARLTAAGMATGLAGLIWRGLRSAGA